jgi:hypothetical protein
VKNIDMPDFSIPGFLLLVGSCHAAPIVADAPDPPVISGPRRAATLG